MPKAKPVSLHPLTFEEAITALIRVDPEKVGLRQKHRHPKTIKKRQKPSTRSPK
jgi:hypothetical protein